MPDLVPHIQQMIVFGIVAVAFWTIGRRLWSQALAFRSRPSRRKATATAKHPPAPPTPDLIQLQIRPPAHLKRPPPEH